MEYRRDRGLEFVPDGAANGTGTGAFQRTMAFSKLFVLFTIVPFAMSAIGTTGAALTTLVYREKRYLP